MWSGYANQSGGSSKAKTEGFVTEGNADILIIGENATRIRFMTENVDVNDVMKEFGIGKEEAYNKLYNDIGNQRWIIPKSYWIHRINAIPNVRFYSKAVCLGRDCPMCEENLPHRENGVENGMLPYPVSKVYYVPVYVYDMQRVLFLKQSEGFFDEIAKYIDRWGSDIDFEVYSIGRGKETRYKSTYLGPSEFKYVDLIASGYGNTYPKPFEFDPHDSPEELTRKLTGGRMPKLPNEIRMDKPMPPKPVAPNPIPPVAPNLTPPVMGMTTGTSSAPLPYAGPPKVQNMPVPPSVSPVAGSFVIQFGSEKGKTLQQIFDEGKSSIIRFYAQNSNGATKDNAVAFCAEKGIQ